MRVVVARDGGEEELAVDLDPARVTVAELARHLGGHAADGLVADGRHVTGELTVAAAGIRDGTLVEPVATAAAGAGATVPGLVADPPPDGAVVELHVVGGTVAGTRHPLAPGVVVIGREPPADVVLAHPTVSAVHARLTVAVDGACTLEDLGGVNGTRVDGAPVVRARTLHPGQVVELGAVAVLLRPPRDAATAPTTPPRGRHTVAFNRPPRPPVPAGPPPVHVPDPPAEDGAPPPALGWAAFLVPLALGLLLAVVVDPRLALFALLSPVMVAATWAEERRRARRGRRRAAAEHDRRLARFSHELAAAVADLAATAAATLTDPAEAVTRAVTSDTRLWERRRDHPDAFRVRLGLGTGRLVPPLTAAAAGPEVAGLVARAARRPRLPVGVRLAPGRALGVVGGRGAALPLLRWLVLAAAVAHGPADLRVAVLTDRPADWSWVHWLPHARTAGPGGDTLLSDRHDDAAHGRLLAAVAGRAATPAAPAVLVVVDDPAAAHGHGAGQTLRALLRDHRDTVAAVVAVERHRDLPDRCAPVVTLDDTLGSARVDDADDGATVPDLVVAGVTATTARRAARALAGLDDPDATTSDRALPDRVRLLELLDLAVPTATALRRRWDGSGEVVATPVGCDAEGPVVVDLVHDGPHALLAGTTGSGKSELLRSLVAGLAASTSPTRLNLLLVDYKGGAAFDACAGLPHTVGVVTDLDDRLAARALACLEAELRWRERRLRDAGAGDLAAYLTTGPEAPLPRLFVVVDEFAALAAELPGFVSSLVDVAQRGRSLGVHLLLATQRPAGVVSDAIRANTDLRIALRVQRPQDAIDVVGAPDAAAVPRERPGRGLLRRGGDEPIRFQTATVTDPPPDARAPVRSRPLGAASPAPAPVAAGPSDLDLLVAACREAAADLPAPRCPWPPPLPERLDPGALDPGALAPGALEPGADPGAIDPAPGGGAVVVGLADEPAAQRQVPYALDPAAGPVALVGGPAARTDLALAAVALALADRHPADDLHLHVLSGGSTALTALRDLPHLGTFVAPGDREREARLVRLLHRELAARRADGGDGPRVVLLVDGYHRLARGGDDAASFRRLEQLEQVVADGAPFGITAVVTIDRPGALPTAVAATLGTTLVLHLTDPLDAAVHGIRADRVPPPLPGRGIDVRTGREVQLAVPAPDALPAAVADLAARTAPARTRRPVRVGTLPEHVPLPRVVATGAAGPDGTWSLPVGMADEDLGAALLRLGPGDHALVAGPARSGRSGTLAAVAVAATRAVPGIVVTAVTPRPGSLAPTAPATAATPDQLPELCATLASARGPHLLLVDDAELLDDAAAGALQELLRLRRPDVRVVAGGRVDALRGSYAAWLAEVRRTRTGVALRPDPDRDGLLWEAQLPRMPAAAWPPGRGYLLDAGAPALVQVARA